MSAPNDRPAPDGPRGDARLLAVLGGALALLTAWSIFRPYDLATWFLEAGPLLAAVVVLALTRRRFPLTPLAYVCVALHGAVLLVGAHYTYAEVPLGRWAQDALGFEVPDADAVAGVILALLDGVSLGLQIDPDLVSLDQAFEEIRRITLFMVVSRLNPELLGVLEASPAIRPER